MAFRKVLTWPSQSLKKKSNIVSSFDDSLAQLVGDLYDTMNVLSGVGIAAPQIGIHQRVVLVDAAQCSLEPEPCRIERVPDNIIVLVNPELELSGPKHRWVESCLSVPDSKGQVERFQYVSLKYQTVTGEEKSVELDWPASGVVQHECDHLDGILYIDRMNRFSRDMLCKKIMKRRKRAAEARRLVEQQEKDELDAINGIIRKKPAYGPGKRKKTKKKSPKKNHLNKKRKKKKR